MRGDGHKSEAETVARHFIDDRSYVSTVLDDNGDPKTYLFGDDMGVRRSEVWEKANRCCVKCGKAVSYLFYEIHHKVRRSQGGCDNLSNLECLCHRCHLSGEHQR